MSRSGEQMVWKAKCEEQRKPEGEKEKLQGLPLESSPYVNYSDLEDYKQKAYGTEGHLEPKPGQGGGATDAPTLSGSGLSEGKAATAAAINQNGTPRQMNTDMELFGSYDDMVRPKRAKTGESSSARPEVDDDYVPPTKVEEQLRESSRVGASSSGVGATSSSGRRQSGSDPLPVVLGVPDTPLLKGLEVTYYGLEVLVEGRPDILLEGVSFFERCTREDSAWSLLDHSSDPE
ncbi:hypothetical protein HHK36_008825 [Tetracentron sinense]|uniref:Uncharacterized protein n=1 Tax=Tetracentron sinense TaxID=13715 RepID=A0A834ZK72_TETSI|nr:hypothetical protein HHK36_008825 [Tetracentron sinense]